MKVLLPIGYFPPLSYFAYLLSNDVSIESKEHFVKQSFRSRCTIMGANGALNLLVPRLRSDVRQTMDGAIIDQETDWKKLHWRSLESAYRKSPYFEYYEHHFEAFFSEPQTRHFEMGLRSVQLACQLLKIPFEPTITSTYLQQFDGLDLRSAWNKQAYAAKVPVAHFPPYIQVFSDRFPFAADLSILDLLFCEGPRSIDHLGELKLTLTP
jgi:hypothetical protein